MEAYKHTVQYYETDKMGITHHSNYIRWMEEARIDFLHQIGWDYDRLESLGIFAPVIEASCRYLRSTTFSDKIYITVSVLEFKGVKIKLHYDMLSSDGIPVAEGLSIHGFLDKDGKPVNLKKNFPEFYDILTRKTV